MKSMIMHKVQPRSNITAITATPCRFLRLLGLVLLLSHLYAAEDAKGSVFESKVRTVAAQIDRSDIPAAKATAATFESPFDQEIQGLFDVLVQKRTAMEMEFGKYVGCRHVRSSNALQFSEKHYYALVFEHNIMMVLFNGYLFNGKTILLGFHVRREVEQMYDQPGPFVPGEKPDTDPEADIIAAEFIKALCARDRNAQIDLIVRGAVYPSRDKPEAIIKRIDEHITGFTFLGNILGSRLIRVYKAGTILRNYAYVLFGDKGHVAIDVELLHKASGGWGVKSALSHELTLE